MRGDRSSVLHWYSRYVSDHHEGILRFRSRLLPRGGIPLLASGMSPRRLRDDTVFTSRMARSVLQTFHYDLSPRWVIIFTKYNPYVFEENPSSLLI